MAIYVEKETLIQLQKDVSKWLPTPYVILGIIRHELKCNLGMQVYVDSLSHPKAILIKPGPNLKFPYLRRALFVNATSEEPLYDLLKSCDIDWSYKFWLFGTPPVLLPVCQKAACGYGKFTLHYPECTMVQEASAAHSVMVTIPDKYIMDRLRVEDIDQILDNWQYAGIFGLDEVRSRYDATKSSLSSRARHSHIHLSWYIFIG